MAEFENKCGSCYWLRDMRDDSEMFSGSCYEKGHCIELKNCYYPDDTICRYYKEKESYVPGGGCYITTLVCDILGYDDKCPILETLRGFRNNVMQKDSKYADILYEYDTVGPEIAKSLRDEADLGLVNGILDYYILPTVDNIRENNYEGAVTLYKTMTKSLEDYYAIPYSKEAPSDYNYTQGGHGVKKLGTYYGNN